ncbi:MAG: DegT/DnrJ/EryC1/StrS family aminotransferase, partial [Acidobacteria bacterium]|nr:DegT/DnrJ/EryC1/StrS family aminotransferase [Acidobacteriota bacterium]
MPKQITRRGFLGAAPAVAAGIGIAARPTPRTNGKLALLGGAPVRTAPFPSWPLVKENDEKAWMEVLRKKAWHRYSGGVYAKQFEETWAKTLGAKYCLAVANGTSALFTSLHALGIGPGDEVLVPPYTFVATVNTVLLVHALPIFVDTDPETFQMDARQIEAAITPRTRCILPVHLGGSAADLDTILAIGKKRNLPVLEDACQAHFGEWRHRKLSTLGDLGCFSFQVSKNLSSGEGGAILTSSEEMIERSISFHNNGRGKSKSGFSYVRNGANLRMTEFQAALLLEQLTRVEEQSRIREQNAAYLTSMLREIPGISPARLYEGCTRNAYHLYMFRYDQQHFAGAPRAKFLKALAAEGIPSSGGYSPLNKEPFLAETLHSRGYHAIYSPQRIAEYEERNHCPANDRLCEEAIWFFQTMLLGSRQDMDQIAEAIRKIR